MKCVYGEQLNENCKECECRHWIDFSEDQNCALMSIAKNGNMTLEEVGKRLHISHVRVKQIQDKAVIRLEREMRDER